MSDVDPPPNPLPRVKARLPFEPNPFGGAVKRGGVLLYAALTIGLAGLALYMATVAGRQLASGYVAAPAIGALWFGLRLFMMLNSRK